LPRIIPDVIVFIVTPHVTNTIYSVVKSNQWERKKKLTPPTATPSEPGKAGKTQCSMNY
jgi:hypothetical protein